MRGFTAAASVHIGGQYIAFDQEKCIEDIKKYEYWSLGSQVAAASREEMLPSLATHA